ncbi:6,7-dimethyl-8-ribityllumazine synthase [Jatrophihabitans telluris]|uniref:6,7-dimethyl-8-ribityllumazine synthase n=1 Tax=Jatrophihabitans telluris TaxID=2038343 RepID=A0ABY4R2P2_9ACTN|nr:6,7-dimethyl-8-ribityllumazine synthase [Jatrophihabitans telluris]UQX90074.1 6,7-dimethyl-8-ribityllumazine synthase [Jatrophihabitans telluris]
MSGHGAPETGAVAGAAGLRVVVIAAQWHPEVMAGLVSGARRALQASEVVEAKVVHVPGTFELAVAAARIAAAGDVDAIVALGVVIRGGTPHFDYVCQAATNGLTDVSVRTGVPVGFGVLTCDDDQQALDRAGLSGSKEDKGFEATQAALAAAVILAGYPLP